MALHLTPEAHDADPPSGWIIRKAGRRWQLCNRNGDVLDTFGTKKEAEAAKTHGRAFHLYQVEGRWFRGDTPPGRRPYSACKAEMDKAATSKES